MVPMRTLAWMGVLFVTLAACSSDTEPAGGPSDVSVDAPDVPGIDVPAVDTTADTGSDALDLGAPDTPLKPDAPAPDACQPRCNSLWACGDDGCGGTCGAGCAENERCVAHVCECVPACAPDQQCGDDGCGGTCGPGCAEDDACIAGVCVCEPRCGASWECGDSGCGYPCGGGCAEGFQCAGHSCVCVRACEPDWQCGDDGCGGQCGAGCPPNHICQDRQCVCPTVCEPDWQCGDDGCGGLCGAGCAAGDVCVDHRCVCPTVCEPDWQCGDDGCGGQCGSGCPLGTACQDHRCVCVPACQPGWQCGSNGCDGECGPPCAPGSACVDHRCVCRPQCAPDWQCGSDGCDGTCGRCGPGQVCVEHVCLQCIPNCPPGWVCGDDGCGGQCGPGCPAGESCEAGQCVHCEPFCAPDWPCGDDGCGGQCGPGCGPGFECRDHTCVCAPQCEPDWQCGDDGCGGECAGGCPFGLDCIDRRCEVPLFGPGVLLNHLELPEYGATPCCFDYTGDGQPDNGLVNLLHLLAGLLGDVDVNEELASAIQAGLIITLFEFRGVGDWQSQPACSVAFYQGADTNDDFSDNLDPAHAGDVLVTPESLDPEGQPLALFETAAIDAGFLQAGPGQVILDIPLMEGMLIHAVLDDARIEAAVTADTSVYPLLVRLDEGRLGGYMAREVILDALNGFAAAGCACLMLPGPLVDIVANRCSTEGQPDLCTGSGEDMCAQLYEYCPTAVGMMPYLMDVDSDGDGRRDSLSLGAYFTAIPAHIVGIDEAARR